MAILAPINLKDALSLILILEVIMTYLSKNVIRVLFVNDEFFRRVISKSEDFAANILYHEEK